MFFFFSFLVIGSECSRHIFDYEGCETSHIFSGPIVQRVESHEKKLGSILAPPFMRPEYIT